MKARVLITDGEQRAALALVRSLGRAGHDSFVCSARSRSLAGGSRYAIGEARVADPLGDPEGYVTAVRRLTSKWEIDTLIPVSEASLLAVLGARELFGSVQIPFVDLSSFRKISDKALVLDTARSMGIAVPAQVVLASPEEAESFDPASAMYPLVLKPSRSVGELNGQRAKVTVGYAGDAAELVARIRELPPLAYPVLLQQRIMGPGVGIFLLLWDGAMLAAFSHRRIREKPPSGGVSVYRESISADPGMIVQSRALLERFGWRGVAMVEYKVDAATGTPYLMEVNGRFWGSLQLAIDAGVDFPALLLEAVSGQATEPVTRYRMGVRSRWWWGDFDRLLALLRRSRHELALAPDAPTRLEAILDFLVLWRPGDRSEIFRWSDPIPGIRETIAWVRRS